VDPRPLLAELRDRVVGAGGPSVYAELFDSIDAGPGADNGAIAESLAQRDAVERSKVEGDLTPEQRERLRETLRALRVSRYEAAAQQVSIFGTPREVLALRDEEASEGIYSVIPLDAEQARPEPGEGRIRVRHELGRVRVEVDHGAIITADSGEPDVGHPTSDIRHLLRARSDLHPPEPGRRRLASAPRRTERRLELQ